MASISAAILAGIIQGAVASPDTLTLDCRFEGVSEGRGKSGTAPMFEQRDPMAGSGRLRIDFAARTVTLLYRVGDGETEDDFITASRFVGSLIKIDRHEVVLCEVPVCGRVDEPHPKLSESWSEIQPTVIDLDGLTVTHSSRTYRHSLGSSWLSTSVNYTGVCTVAPGR